MRRIVMLMVLILCLLPLTALAAEPPPLEGTYSRGGPILSRDPLPHESATCFQGELIIRVGEKLPDVNQLASLDYIFDRGGLFSQYATHATIYLNGTWIVGAPISAFTKEAHAFKVKESGRIMMPIRFFTEAIGGEVSFEDGWIHLSYNGTEVLLKARDTTAYVNGKDGLCQW